MAKTTQCEKLKKRQSPSDKRRREAVRATSPEPSKCRLDYAPKNRGGEAPQHLCLPATDVLEAIDGYYRIKEMSGVVVEVLKNRNDESAIRIVQMPRSDEKYDVWCRDKNTFLPVHFVIDRPSFRSAVPEENMRAVQQLIFTRFRPYAVGLWKRSRMTLVPKAVPGEVTDEPIVWSSRIMDFANGVAGHYVFPLRGPQARFQVRKLQNGISYRFISADDGNPLHAVPFGTSLSHRQIVGETRIPAGQCENAEPLRNAILAFYKACGVEQMNPWEQKAA